MAEKRLPIPKSFGFVHYMYMLGNTQTYTHSLTRRETDVTARWVSNAWGRESGDRK